MNQGILEKPTSIKKTLLQEAKVIGFYAQYDKTPQDYFLWITDEDMMIPDDIKELLSWHIEIYDISKSDNKYPCIYLRDLNYQPIAYLVAEGMIVYCFPEKYLVPSLHSTAKIQPDFEAFSVMNQLIKSIEGRQYTDLFETYHVSMIYGEFNMADLVYSDYTRNEWVKLTNYLKQDQSLIDKLNLCLDKIRAKNFTIQSIAENIGGFLEKELKQCLRKINIEKDL